MTTPVTYRSFWSAVLVGLGAPVNRGNLRCFGVVTLIEGRNDYWNPMNWTLPETFPAFNDVGVRMYPNSKVGIMQTRTQLLVNSRWQPFVQVMREGPRTRLPGLKALADIYAQWGSYPKFLAVSVLQAAAVLDEVMVGP